MSIIEHRDEEIREVKNKRKQANKEKFKQEKLIAKAEIQN